MEQNNTPRKAMQVVVWVIYATVVAWILYAIERVGSLQDWQWSDWSFLTWVAVGSFVAATSGVIYLFVRFKIDGWCTAWERKLVKQEVIKKLEEQYNED